jgi:hypothetical protein
MPAVPPTPPPPTGPLPATGDTPPPGSRTGLIIGIVVAVLAVIGVGAFFLTRDDDETVTSDSAPEVTNPDDSAPDVTIPDVTASDVTIPDITSPDLTVPDDITIPDITIPDFTIPDITIPDFTIPDITIPDFTIPDFSIPDFSIPDIVLGPIPPAVDPPDGLGSDAQFNDLAQECYDGTMLSCDTLYDDTVADSALEAYTVYGDTCAGRQPENTQRYCRDSFPGE